MMVRLWAVFFVGATCCAAGIGQDAALPRAAGQAVGNQQVSDRMAADKAAAELARKAAKGDADARDVLMKDANGGAAAAQFYLALLYKDGLGVSQDDVRYGAWLRKAGLQDHAGAQSRLIGIYEEGKGVTKDVAQAAQWARRAADQGELAGQLALVKDYFYGRGVASSVVEAIKWQAVLEARGFVAHDDAFTSEMEQAAGPIRAEEGRALAREWLKAPHGGH